MSYQALYRAWRPDTFTEMVGQDAITRTLKRQEETRVQSLGWEDPLE